MSLSRWILGSATVVILGCKGGCAPAPPPVTNTPPATSVTTTAAAPATPGVETRPLYYERALTSADLDGRSLMELSLMRNTIFARAGNPFQKPWLDNYFRAQSWYVPAAKMDGSKLTEIDAANAAMISDRENSFSREQLLAMKEAVNPADPNATVELSLLSGALGEWVGDAGVAAEARNPLEDPTVLAQQLTLAQIDEMSRRDLRLLRNTIYARHGRPFKSEILQMYFTDKAWYLPDPGYSDKALTAVDQRNITLVQSVEDRLGGALSDWDHRSEEGWFSGA